MIEKSDIRACFPEIGWIEDKELQEKVVSVWKAAADRGGWERLDQVPFTLLFENSGPLVDHTKRVALLVWNIGNARDEHLNRDVLAAGVLLHDVGKLLEYELKDGRVAKSELGMRMRHPKSGAKLAEEFGLPKEVVHIIAAHSHEGDSMTRTPEAIIVHHCDFIDFEIIRSLLARPK